MIHRQTTDRVRVLDAGPRHWTLLLVDPFGPIDTHTVLTTDQLQSLYFEIGAALETEGMRNS